MKSTQDFIYWTQSIELDTHAITSSNAQSYHVKFDHSCVPFNIRYDAFRQLAEDLAIPGKTPASASFSALSKFPPKTSAIFGCTEQELSERTRLLDRWLREVCSCYKLMGDRNRLLVRNFLCFDMSNDLEIYLQDKMMNGQIEGPRAEIFVPPNFSGTVGSSPDSRSYNRSLSLSLAPLIFSNASSYKWYSFLSIVSWLLVLIDLTALDGCQCQAYLAA